MVGGLTQKTAVSIHIFFLRPKCIGGFFPYLTDKQRTDFLKAVITATVRFAPVIDCLKLPDTRRTTLRWQSCGRSDGLALIGQEGNMRRIYTKIRL